MFVFGHRGGAPQHPECTAEALAAGIAAGADGVEFDIRVTADGAVVINHDRTLTRVWEVPRSVREMSLAQVRAVTANGYRVATIDEALDAAADGISIIDCKEADAIAPTLAAIDRARAEDRVIFVGDGFALLELRALRPTAPIALTWWDTTPPGEALLAMLAPRYFSQCFDALDAPLLAAQQNAGRQVWTWQVNGKAALERALAFGVDGVATDDVADLLAHLRSDAVARL